MQTGVNGRMRMFASVSLLLASLTVGSNTSEAVVLTDAWGLIDMDSLEITGDIDVTGRRTVYRLAADDNVNGFVELPNWNSVYKTATGPGRAETVLAMPDRLETAATGISKTSPLSIGALADVDRIIDFVALSDGFFTARVNYEQMISGDKDTAEERNHAVSNAMLEIHSENPNLETFEQSILNSHDLGFFDTLDPFAVTHKGTLIISQFFSAGERGTFEISLGTHVSSVGEFSPLNPTPRPAPDDFEPSGDPVPEPATIYLLGSGLLGLAGWKSRNRIRGSSP